MEYVDVMERVLLAGSSLMLNGLSDPHCQRLVMAAKSGRGCVTFVGSFTFDGMIALSTLGGKHVAFDIAKYQARE